MGADQSGISTVMALSSRMSTVHTCINRNMHLNVYILNNLSKNYL